MLHGRDRRAGCRAPSLDTKHTSHDRLNREAGVPHMQREPSEGWTWLGPKVGSARRLLRSVTEH